ERLDGRQMVAEGLMLGMRMTQGISDAQVEAASEVLEGVVEAYADLQARGLVIHENGRYIPSKRGWLLGNELYGALLELAP
ncbi:MAG: coproporphyrinogen III oxidase family protein, partial [Coriobacteriia bacterium]|nr:coproporphyrinogen III oxidase family protein [Coriobacteriia bacterium]